MEKSTIFSFQFKKLKKKKKKMEQSLIVPFLFRYIALHFL